MEGLECMDGGRIWNLMLYTRMPLKVVGLGDFRCLGLTRKGKVGEEVEEEGRVRMEGYFKYILSKSYRPSL